MATEQSTKSQTKAEKLINLYMERLKEINSTDISELFLEEIEELCNGFESELNTLDKKKASILSIETRSSIKHQYQMIIQRYRNTTSTREGRTKMKTPKTESKEPSFEEVSTVRKEFKKIKSIEIIDENTIKIESEFPLSDEDEVIGQILSHVREIIHKKKMGQTDDIQSRDTVKGSELITELTKLQASINQSQEPTSERQIFTAVQESETGISDEIIDDEIEQEIIRRILKMGEMSLPDKEVISQMFSHTRQKKHKNKMGQTDFIQCRDTVKCNEIITELAKLKAPVNKSQETSFEKQISTLREELEELKSKETIGSIQHLVLKIEKEFERLDEEITDQFLNVEIGGSIDLIEKTLAEPHLYSLPHLIMWRNTAQEKIQKIKNFPKPISQEIVTEKIEIYESLIIQLRTEILKLRTYPIPEPWCSHCMRDELAHLIEFEFIFFVYPELEEDMKPLRLSERETQPGGLTRQEYDSRMNRMKRESTIAIEKLKAKNAGGMERKLKWFEDSFTEIEKDVNFAFTELTFLHKDGRTLEYLVDKNQDDELLQEIYDTLLRRIRHIYNNRINIPSVAIDYYNDPKLVAPPKAERNTPIASGVDRGATEGLQLVTPASVVVYKNTVFVADKYGHSISYYRDSDLETIGSYHHTTADTPVSITICNGSLFACYIDELVQFRFTWGKKYAKGIHLEASTKISQICCTVNYNYYDLFVGTLKPSLIYIDPDTLQIEQEYPMNPIRYRTNKKNRYPWLQDMKATSNSIICLFTGSPSPLQEFSMIGELLRSVLTEEEIVGAYHFNMFWNRITDEWRVFVTDFWYNAIKVFDREGQFVETYSEKGFDIGQIIQPTGIFVEESGFITVCDMKEVNCLQRL